jgi:hypothetical protein
MRHPRILRKTALRSEAQTNRKSECLRAETIDGNCGNDSISQGVQARSMPSLHRSEAGLSVSRASRQGSESALPVGRARGVNLCR